MKTLVVYTYPHRESLNAAVLDHALAGLEQNPRTEEVRVLDLYAEGFNPVLVFNAEQRRRDMHRVAELEPYREMLLWAELIVFIYPIWWGRPPAMLLGFFDRMMASNFAYRDRPGKNLPDGLLAGRSVVCLSTMKGPPGYLQYWLYNSHRVLMKKALFQFVGIKKVKFFEFGRMERRGGRQPQVLAKTRNYLAAY